MIDPLEKVGFVRRAKDPADRRRVIIEPFADRIEREIGPLFQSLAPALADLCARYNIRELAVIRDFIAGFHQLAYEQMRKLREGDRQSNREGPLEKSKRGSPAR